VSDVSKVVMDVSQMNHTQNVFYYTKGCVAWKNLDGTYQAISRHFEKKMAPFAHKTIIGCSDEALFDGTVLANLLGQDRAVIAAKQSIVFDLDVTVSGQIFAQRMIKTPMFDQAGRCFGIMVEYIAKPGLKAVVVQDNEQDELILSFIRDMEHDLRTPLSGILGLARILYGRDNDQTTQDYLGLIVQSTEEVIEYCQNILAFSKVSRKRYPTWFRVFKLERMLEKILAMQLPAARNKNIVLQIEQIGNIPAFIKTDAYRMEKIFVNLIANAIKFTDVGGVFVHIDYMMLFKSYSVISVVIKDTGRGMPDYARAFLSQDPSAEATDNHNPKIGLGLQIVRDFVNDLGGDIQTKSQAGIGSEIHLVIPLQNMDYDHSKLPLTNLRV